MNCSRLFKKTSKNYFFLIFFLEGYLMNLILVKSVDTIIMMFYDEISYEWPPWGKLINAVESD